MKNYQLIIFLAIVLSVYSLANIYIFMKGFNALNPQREHSLLFTLVFIGFAASFVIAKFLESRHSSVFTDTLNVIGGFWMGFMLYAVIFLLLSDFIYVILRVTRVLDPVNFAAYKKWAFIAVSAVSGILILGGFINAITPVVTEYNIAIDKPADGIKQLRVAAVSDIHLGSVIRKRSIRKLSSVLEGLHPDAVFLLGDIVDGELGPVLRDDLLQYFTPPVTTDGLYAITGNHEFIGGAKRTVPYIESKGIRVLKDEVIVLPCGIQVAGRLDRDSRRFYGSERATLEDLLKNVDKTRPVILLDHQPFHLGETEKNGVDLQLSGHTHNGQMWPLNYLTGAMYELSYGYLKKGNTQVIVSSGYGLWGPRIRSGSRSEVILVNIKFRDQN
jgi:uncharacterized protein